MSTRLNSSALFYHITLYLIYNAVNLIVNIYDLREIIDEKFDDDTFKKMINSAVKNLTHVLIGSFGYGSKEKQFTEWFNDTYMDQ